jgi:hypothetical protein
MSARRHDLSGARLLPDFNVVFAPQPGSPCRTRELLTPRNAAHLWVAATELADILDAQLTHATQPILLSHSDWDRLPWVATGARMEWCGRFIDAIFDLADDVASGHCPVPRCTGEEMALRLILEDIADPGNPYLTDLTEIACDGLPISDWDGNWDVVATELFPDARVRSLISDNFGGIDDDYDLVAETGIVRLAVERWFDAHDDRIPERPTRPAGAG